MSRARRRASRYSRGLTPSTRRKARSTWCGERPIRRPIPARSAAASGRASMVRHTSRTMATAGSGERAMVGRQRRQGRNPAAWAASGMGKKRTTDRRGRRLGQDGRQNTPVERTA